jgi:hypothetical protein
LKDNYFSNNLLWSNLVPNKLIHNDVYFSEWFFCNSIKSCIEVRGNRQNWRTFFELLFIMMQKKTIPEFWFVLKLDFRHHISLTPSRTEMTKMDRSMKGGRQGGRVTTPYPFGGSINLPSVDQFHQHLTWIFCVGRSQNRKKTNWLNSYAFGS